LWPIAERFDMTENNPDLGMLGEAGFHGGIMASRHHVIIVEEVDKRPARIGPSQVSYDAWYSASGVRIFHINDAAIPKGCRYFLRRAVQTVVDDENFERYIALSQHAGNCLRQLRRATAGRDDRRKLDGHGLAGPQPADW